jgi:hypothetical protein
VKDYYESLKLYNESNEQKQEVYVPLVIAEHIQDAVPIGISLSLNIDANQQNPFIDYSCLDYQYVEATIPVSK